MVWLEHQLVRSTDHKFVFLSERYRFPTRICSIRPLLPFLPNRDPTALETCCCRYFLCCKHLSYMSARAPPCPRSSSGPATGSRLGSRSGAGWSQNDMDRVSLRPTISLCVPKVSTIVRNSFRVAASSFKFLAYFLTGSVSHGGVQKGRSVGIVATSMGVRPPYGCPDRTNFCWYVFSVASNSEYIFFASGLVVLHSRIRSRACK